MGLRGDLCLGVYSDHTSWTLSRVLMCSNVSMTGERPPCKQKT